MRKPEEIITDAEIIAVHANANFGGRTPREVVNEGVRKYAVGYSGGHTMQCILREHGLITKPKGYSADLTKKGKEYARSIGDAQQEELAAEKARADQYKDALSNISAMGFSDDPAVAANIARYAVEMARKARGL